MDGGDCSSVVQQNTLTASINQYRHSTVHCCQATATLPASNVYRDRQTTNK